MEKAKDYISGIFKNKSNIQGKNLEYKPEHVVKPNLEEKKKIKFFARNYIKDYYITEFPTQETNPFTINASGQVVEIDPKYEGADGSPKMMTSFHNYHYTVATSVAFQLMIFAVIIINIAVIVVNAIPTIQVQVSFYMIVVDRICLGIFIFECGVNIVAFKKHYFTSVSHLFDLVIILLSIIETLESPLALIAENTSQLKTVLLCFRGLRSLRIFRAMRIFNFIPSFKKTFQTAFKASKTISSMLLLWFFSIHIFSTIAYLNYRETQPENYGTYGLAFVSMFRCGLHAMWGRLAFANDGEALHFMSAYIFIQYLIFFSIMNGIITSSMVYGSQEIDHINLMKKDKEDERIEREQADLFRKSTQDKSGINKPFMAKKEDEVMSLMEEVEVMILLQKEMEKMIENVLDAPIEIMNLDV